MSRQVPFDIEVASGRVPGMLRLPGDAEDAAPAPAVIICGDLPGSAEDHGDLVEALAARIVDRGAAIALFQARLDDEAAARDVATIIEDAAAVFRWIQSHDAVDARAIGVIGVGLGAIVAAGLAGRTNELSRLCLVAPATNDVAVARLAKPNGVAPLLAPDAAVVASAAWVASLEAMTPAVDLALNDRPTLVVHGAADRVVTSVKPYLDAVEGAGHRIEYERIARADHQFTSPDLREVCLSRVERFFRDLGAATGNGKKKE